MKQVTRLAKGFGGAAKAFVAAIAIALAGSAQAEFISPGITVNGIKPTADGSYSGFTYKDGVFTLNSAGTTYALKGIDESGKVRIVVAANCTLEMRSLTLSLSKVHADYYNPTAGSPISLSGNVNVTVVVYSTSYLYGGYTSPGLCVQPGQTVTLKSINKNELRVSSASGGSAALGSGYWTPGCGTIIIEGWVRAQGLNQGCAIGCGSNIDDYGSGSIVIKEGANVNALGYYPSPAIGMGSDVSGTMDITISGGSVIATQGNGGGAAIGTGWRTSGTCNVTISGGLVETRVEGDSGAGIGTGLDSTAEMNIKISGGRVRGFGGGLSAGIGGGENANTPNITISGGTIRAWGDENYTKAMDIGKGKDANTEGSVVVTGGSLYLDSDKGSPTAADGTALNCVTVRGFELYQDVEVSLTTSKGKYGANGIKADYNGWLHLWVPPANYVDKLYIDGIRYDVDASSGDATATRWQPPPPANDNFANAQVISGASGRIFGDNTRATKEGDLKWYNPYMDAYFSADDEGSVWYSWTAPASGPVTFLAVHDEKSGGACMSLRAFSGTSRTALDAGDERNSSLYPEENMGVWGGRVEFTAVKGTTYKICVAHLDNGSMGAFTLMWDYFKEGDWALTLRDDGTAKIGFMSGFYRGGAVNIPAKIFGCPVKVVLKHGFMDAVDITSVTIPEGVQTIGASAFNGCTSLTRVDMPQSLTTIGENAFKGCVGLENITIPPGVATIRESAFYGCTHLNAVALPHITTLEEKVFYNCTKLWAVTLPETLTKIYPYSFYGCPMQSIVIPASVTEIWAGAFYSCANLKNVAFLGSRPATPTSLYAGTPEDLVTYVPADDTTWSEAVAAGTWRKRAIKTGVPVSSYKVTFGKNGGTGGSDQVTATYGAAMPAATAPTKSGYAFAGYWDTIKEGGKQYYDKDMKSVRAWDKTANTTLWAKWEQASVSVKVTFGKNGGTGGDNHVTATTGKPMPTPRTAPTLSGYTFGGYWDTLALDANGNPKGKQYYDANMKSVRNWDKTSEATLWAKWTNKVTFGKNGGTGGDNYVTCTKGQPMPKRTMPTKAGYVFDGYWNTTGAGGVKYYNADGTSAHVWDRSGT